MKRILLITILAILGAVSCSHQETVPAVGNGELRIVFNSGDLITKSDPLPSWNDGSGIYIDNSDPSNPDPDLVILVADASSGSIIGKYPDAVNAKLEGSPTSTSMSVSIKGLGDGIGDRNVIVFAFANNEGLWSMQIPGSPATPVTDLTLLTDKTQVESLMFTPLSADTCPELIDIDPLDDEDVLDRLPLSARATTTVASNGNGEVSLAMLRCVAKVTAELINKTGSKLTMYDFHNEFVGMCPNSGYVMAGSNPDTPETATGGDIVGDESSLEILAGKSFTKSWYVFPSTGPYSCNIDFWLDSTKTDPEQHFSYSDLEIHDDHARDLTELKRNQHLHIVTNISKGLTVSFSFEVMDWTLVTENVIFH